jgi:hypothetical protein
MRLNFSTLCAVLLWCLSLSVHAEEQVQSSKPLPALMAEAREILKTEADPADAIAALNQILLSPDNEFTREAHELIITAYERAGKPLRAAAEIKLYLQLYPDSNVTKRVRERLIAIEIANPLKGPNALEYRKPKTDKEVKFDASLSEYLYGTSSTSSLLGWKSEQLVSITNLRTTGTYRDGDVATKVTIRDTQQVSLINHDKRATLQLANIDVNDTFRGYEVKLGRQNPTYGAVSRFDGVLAKYDFQNGVRLGASTGQPTIASSVGARTFYGLGVELEQSSSLSGSIYYNQQTVQGLLERKAIGVDAHYTDGKISGMFIAEYDLLYGALNSMLLQAYTTSGPYTWYALVDRRRSPMLLIDRALSMGMDGPSRQAYGSVQELLTARYSSPELYTFISATTPIATSYVLSLGRKVSENWDVTTDIQVSNISQVIDPLFIPTVDAPVSSLQQPASGDLVSWNLHLYGNNVFHRTNTVNLLLSLTRDRTSQSQIVTLTDSQSIGPVKAELTLYALHMSRPPITRGEVMASVRLNYRLSERSTIEGQVGISRSTTNNTPPVLYNQSFFAGYRLDF